MEDINKLLEIRNLKKYFPVRKGIFQRVVGQIKAVDDVSFFIKTGETLGLVGESGCGKSTAGRTMLRLIEPTSGKIIFRSKKLAKIGKPYKEIDIASASSNQLKSLREEIQIIFQDPYSSLNPRMKVESIIGEPLLIHGMSKGSKYYDRITYLLESVGLTEEHMHRFPHQFSGGQRQRIGIARALASEPQLIIADEPVSALDVSIQAQVVNLLLELQKKFSLTFLFIAHDLSVIKYISDRVLVMYLGKIVEQAKTEELFKNPKHPYTEALISSVPIPNPQKKVEQIILDGDVPSPLEPPPGCVFHTRCRYAQDICKTDIPPIKEMGSRHFTSCHFADTLKLNTGTL